MKKILLLSVFFLWILGEISAQCGSCAAACPACGFTTPPPVATVTATCPSYAYTPPITSGSTSTRCATFTANNTTVSFNVIVNSTCNAGNVTAFSWTLQQSSCGAVVQSGTLTSLTFTGLTIGQQYTYCYTFTVPNICYHWLLGYYTCTCEHTTHYPYFVGGVPLPIELMSFQGKVADNKEIELSWITSSEINNEVFIVEKSMDGETFQEIGRIEGAGNSSVQNDYFFLDDKPTIGTNYYRLAQKDYDGTKVYSGMTSVDFEGGIKDLILHPNPSTGITNMAFNSSLEGDAELIIYDGMGKIVLSKMVEFKKGHNHIALDETANFSKGIYLVNLNRGTENSTIRFIKN